jgi:hypothetical protein
MFHCAVSSNAKKLQGNWGGTDIAGRLISNICEITEHMKENNTGGKHG